MEVAGFQATLRAAQALTERCADAVSQALLDGQAPRVEAAARDLQQACQSLAVALQASKGRAVIDPQLRQRLGMVARAVAMQREACARRTAAVERSLHSILPASRASTYAGASGPYGRASTHSGAFGMLAA